MNKEKVCLVVGVSAYEKDGNKSCTIQLLGQYASWEKEAGAEGFKAFHEWTRNDFSYLKPGDVVSLVYDRGFQDKAVLDDVIVHKDISGTVFADMSNLLADVPFKEPAQSAKPEKAK